MARGTYEPDTGAGGAALTGGGDRTDFSDLPENVTALAGECWKIALEHAQAGVGNILASELRAMCSERLELEQAMEALTTDSAALRQQLLDAREGRDLASARVIELQGLVSRLEAQIEELKRRHEI